MKRRVVVTGMGVVSPIGVGISLFRKNLFEGMSGRGPIQSFEAASFPVREAFEVRNFEARSHGTHLLDPFIQYAVAAAGEAIQMAGFEPEHADLFRIAISVSSSKGGVHTIDRFKERFVKHPSAILGARIYANTVPNFGAQWIARRWKIQGPAKCFVAACATGTVAVTEGARMVSDGTADYCVAGASDASVVPVLLAAYRNMKALSRQERMRPFDKRRDGFMVGEGAGIVFLETLESAKARGAKIFGEILGGAYGSDATDALHFNRAGDGLARALGKALADQKMEVEDIDYINLHGTATVLGDLYETEQIKKAFGRKAFRVPMSSIKGATGHMLGASGAVEVIATLLAMQESLIPPTLGLEMPDPACDLDYTPLTARAAKIDRAISLSMGFGGHIAVLALGKP